MESSSSDEFDSIEKNKEQKYIVAIVFSNWTLSKIVEFFRDYLECKEDDIGITKIERFRDRKSGEMKDSNRTLILIKKELYNKAIEAGLNIPQPNLDFRISEYIIKDKSKPAENYTSNLYLIIPKNVTIEEAEYSIMQKLNRMVSFEMLNKEDFSLKIPLQSRLTGEHRGFAYLSFSINVDLVTKIFIKALLHDSFMYIQSIDKLYHLPAFWAKDTKTLPSVPKIVKILKREDI